MDATTSLPLIELATLGGNSPAKLNALQQMMEPNIHLFVALFGALWLTVAVYVVYFLLKNGDRHPSN